MLSIMSLFQNNNKPQDPPSLELSKDTLQLTIFNVYFSKDHKIALEQLKQTGIAVTDYLKIATQVKELKKDNNKVAKLTRKIASIAKRNKNIAAKINANPDIDEYLKYAIL